MGVCRCEVPIGSHWLKYPNWPPGAIAPFLSPCWSPNLRPRASETQNTNPGNPRRRSARLSAYQPQGAHPLPSFPKDLSPSATKLLGDIGDARARTRRPSCAWPQLGRPPGVWCIPLAPLSLPRFVGCWSFDFRHRQPHLFLPPINHVIPARSIITTRRLTLHGCIEVTLGLSAG